MQDRLRQLLVIVFAVLDVVSSVWLGSSLDQGGDPTPVYFLPFGPTFAIWGVIYLGGLVYGVYQALPGQGERVLHRRIGWWVALNGAMTALWNFTAGSAGQQGEPGFQPLLVVLTVGILFVMLFALTRAFITFRQLDAELSRRDRWLAQFPVTTFFAWLNVAMIANTAAALDALGFTGEPNSALWAAGMLVVATLLAALMILYTCPGTGTVVYAAVIVWAVLGIFYNNVDRSPLVAVICAASMAVVISLALWHLRRGRSHLPHLQEALLRKAAGEAGGG